MSHLGQFLATLMKEAGLDAKRMSERLGVHESVLSRLLTGERRTCSDRTKSRIVLRCSTRRIKQAHCLAAYLQDQIPKPLERHVRITCG